MRFNATKSDRNPGMSRATAVVAMFGAGLADVLADSLAETGARFRSAWERLADIHEEYSKGLAFTDEMKMRLALVEKDVALDRRGDPGSS